jgi:prephenate dehydratase
MTSPKLLYLGPDGTFTHQAALALAPDGVRLLPLESLARVLEDLAAGEADYAVAALNSAAGPIKATQDAIEAGAVEVLKQHALPVSFDLYRAPGDDNPLVGVYGHEKALAQCAAWITARTLHMEAVASNTAGLAKVADRAEPGWGAIGPPGLATAYGLEVCGQALEGPTRNETLFVLLRRAEA